jgi:RNA polymerase sigma-70 factor (ECF subfamily)
MRPAAPTFDLVISTRTTTAVGPAPVAPPAGETRFEDGWFERLVDEYQGIAFAVAQRVVGDAAVAEDVVQESFLSIWRQAASYDGGRGSLRTWVLTVVRNRAIDRVRSERSRATAGASNIDALPTLRAATDVWADVCAGLDREAVQRALAGLPGEQRATIELAYFGGLTHVEVAARMGVPLGTVKGRMRIGLQKLRAALIES